MEMPIKHVKTSCVWKKKWECSSPLNAVNGISVYFYIFSLVFQSLMPEFFSYLALANSISHKLYHICQSYRCNMKFPDKNKKDKVNLWFHAISPCISQARMLHTCSVTSVTPYVLGLILTHPLIFNPTVSTSGMIFQGMPPDSASTTAFITLYHCYLPKHKLQVFEAFSVVFLFLFYSTMSDSHKEINTAYPI